MSEREKAIEALQDLLDLTWREGNIAIESLISIGWRSPDIAAAATRAAVRDALRQAAQLCIDISHGKDGLDWEYHNGNYDCAEDFCAVKIRALAAIYAEPAEPKGEVE